MLAAGIDSSTQGCKVEIVDTETGITVRQGRASHPAGTEVHPDVWIAALNTAIEASGGLADVGAVAVSGQQHGMILIDSSGHIVRPALLWNDTRSADAAKDLIAEAGGPEIYAAKIGIVPVASFTAAKLRWVRDHEPEMARRVAAVALPHDYLTWRLMGYGPENPRLDALVTDRSDASGTAYWSSVSNCYLPEFFELAFGRPMIEAGSTSTVKDAVIVPRVLKSGEPAGKLPSGAIVGAGTGDNAGGALGLGAVPGDVIVSIGTSGAVFSPAAQVPFDPSGTVAGFCDASGNMLPLVCTLNGARVLQAGCRLLEVTPDELSSLALQAEPGAGGMVLIPYFEGERTPNLPDATGSLQNLTLKSATRPNMARAFVEGVVSSLAEGIKAIEKFGVETKRIYLIGGAAANPAVRGCACRIFSQPIYVPTPAEYVARGAALQATWTLTGKKPNWTLPLDCKLDPQVIPSVYEQYALARKRAYPSTDGAF